MNSNKPQYRWNSESIFMVSYQSILLVSLPIYFYFCSPTWGMIAASIALFWLSGISITAGYHRYFAHRSYKTNRFIEAILLFFGSMAIQGSVLQWAFDHRKHHAHVDTDEDPYSISKGFWYAHFLWIMHYERNIDPKIVSDLLKNPLVMFQHRYAVFCMFGSNILCFLLAGFLLNDFIGAFVLATWTRLFFLHHFTWFINSLAHTWGDKPFCQEQSAVNNFIISLVTFGEGYHNYHHTYANDYRNGVRWYHFDPSKWLIWTLHKLGLASGLRRMDYYTINKRIVLERKNLLLNRLKNHWNVKRDDLEKKIEEVSDRIMKKTANFKQLTETYYRLKQERKDEMVANLRLEIKHLKKSIREDWRVWSELSNNIMHLKPVSV